METNNRIKEIQEEYFNFCLTLLQNVPIEVINEGKLATKAYQLRDNLSAAITQHEKDFYGDAVKVIRAEIKELKKKTQNNPPDT